MGLRGEPGRPGESGKIGPVVSQNDRASALRKS